MIVWWTLIAEFFHILRQFVSWAFDYICEKKGSWNEAVKTMSHIAYRLRGEKGALPNINCVVSNLILKNCLILFVSRVGSTLLLLIELLSDPKEGAVIGEAVLLISSRNGSSSEDTGVQIQTRIEKAYNQIIKMKEEGWPILIQRLISKPVCSILKRVVFQQKVDVGRLYFSITPNGQCIICHRTQHQHLYFLDPMMIISI